MCHTAADNVNHNNLSCNISQNIRPMNYLTVSINVLTSTCLVHQRQYWYELSSNTVIICADPTNTFKMWREGRYKNSLFDAIQLLQPALDNLLATTSQAASVTLCREKEGQLFPKSERPQFIESLRISVEK